MWLMRGTRDRRRFSVRRWRAENDVENQRRWRRAMGSINKYQTGWRGAEHGGGNQCWRALRAASSVFQRGVSFSATPAFAGIVTGAGGGRRKAAVVAKATVENGVKNGAEE